LRFFLFSLLCHSTSEVLNRFTWQNISLVSEMEEVERSQPEKKKGILKKFIDLWRFKEDEIYY
jgi:flagellar motor switch protein FliG